jgi:hypothetical protein
VVLVLQCGGVSEGVNQHNSAVDAAAPDMGYLLQRLGKGAG